MCRIRPVKLITQAYQGVLTAHGHVPGSTRRPPWESWLDSMLGGRLQLVPGGPRYSNTVLRCSLLRGKTRRSQACN